MPGRVFRADPDGIVGWAWHPRFQSYHPVIHLALRTVILRSCVADGTAPSGLPPEADDHWFAIDLATIMSGDAALHELQLLIGETDEWFSPFAPPNDLATRPITIEEILGASFRRPWITGEIYHDAEMAGVSPETVVDMFYRDYLGRPADPNGLAHYAGRVRNGGLTPEALRNILITSREYKLRRRHIYDAPGAIFSHRIVLMEREPEQEVIGEVIGPRLLVPADEILDLDGERFVEVAYQMVLGKDVDPNGLAHYLWELDRGRQKLDILRALAGDLEAVTRGVSLSYDLRTDHEDSAEVTIAPERRPGVGINREGFRRRRPLSNRQCASAQGHCEGWKHFIAESALSGPDEEIDAAAEVQKDSIASIEKREFGSINERASEENYP